MGWESQNCFSQRLKRRVRWREPPPIAEVRVMYQESGRSVHLGCWNPMCQHQNFECLKVSDCKHTWKKVRSVGSISGSVTEQCPAKRTASLWTNWTYEQNTATKLATAVTESQLQTLTAKAVNVSLFPRCTNQLNENFFGFSSPQWSQDRKWTHIINIQISHCSWHMNRLLNYTAWYMHVLSGPYFVAVYSTAISRYF